MTNDLPGRQILVVEDEYAIADDLVRALRKNGLAALRPVADAETAMAALDGLCVDFAIVDINLGGAISFEVAAELRRRGIPFLFLTGYEQAIVPPEYDDVILLPKPHDSDRIIAEVMRQEGKASPST